MIKNVGVPVPRPLVLADGMKANLVVISQESSIEFWTKLKAPPNGT
jgi:hypothetical protein